MSVSLSKIHIHKLSDNTHIWKQLANVAYDCFYDRFHNKETILKSCQYVEKKERIKYVNNLEFYGGSLSIFNELKPSTDGTHGQICLVK